MTAKIYNTEIKFWQGKFSAVEVFGKFFDALIYQLTRIFVAFFALMLQKKTKNKQSAVFNLPQKFIWLCGNFNDYSFKGKLKNFQSALTLKDFNNTICAGLRKFFTRRLSKWIL